MACIERRWCFIYFLSQKKPLVDERVKNVIVWVKNNWTAGDLEGDFGNQYELIAFLPKSKFRLKSKRYSNVWFFDKVIASDLEHPTEKPINLLKRLVESSTTPGDLVLDCFVGGEFNGSGKKYES